MTNTFGIYKKLTLTFTARENDDLLPVLAVSPHKYVGSRKDGNSVLRYYRAGFQLMRSDEFVEKYGLRPTTPFILLLSMNKDTMPDGKRVIKVRNKVSLILPIEISSVRDGDNVYLNPGLSIDPTIFDYVQLSVNIYTGVGEIIVKVAEMKDYIETTSDVIRSIQRSIDPVVDSLSLALQDNVVEVWRSPEGESLMIDYIMSMLTKTGLMNPLFENARENLAHRLLSTSSKETVSDDNMMRMRHLMDDLTFEQRLKELTREEVENTTDLTRPNITMAMTEDEIDEWFAKEGTDGGSELELIALTRYLSV